MVVRGSSPSTEKLVTPEESASRSARERLAMLVFDTKTTASFKRNVQQLSVRPQMVISEMLPTWPRSTWSHGSISSMLVWVTDLSVHTPDTLPSVARDAAPLKAVEDCVVGWPSARFTTGAGMVVVVVVVVVVV